MPVGNMAKVVVAALVESSSFHVPRATQALRYPARPCPSASIASYMLHSAAACHYPATTSDKHTAPDKSAATEDKPSAGVEHVRRTKPSRPTFAACLQCSDGVVLPGVKSGIRGWLDSSWLLCVVLESRLPGLEK